MPRVLLAFEPPDGGVAEHVGHLATHLAPHGWEVEVAGPQEATIYPRLATAGVTVYRLPLSRRYDNPRADYVALRRLRELLQQHQYDLVHCHSAKAGVLGRIAARRAGLPVVYAPHGLPFVGPCSAVRRISSRLVERALAPGTERIICVSEYERQQAAVAGLGDQGQLRVVLNGCPPPSEVPGEVEELRAMAAAGPMLGAVSLLRPGKRVDLLLDVTPEILRRVPEARVVIVGNGPMAETLHRQAHALNLDGDPRFRFLPFVPPASRYLNLLDVFALVSDTESLPVSLLEALASGVPQIATDVGGVGEVVTRETGILVPRHDQQALRDAAIALLSDAPRRGRMGEASLVRYRDAFTLERMMDQTAAIYAEVLTTAVTPATRGAGTRSWVRKA